jgi:hypothetical protein
MQGGADEIKDEKETRAASFRARDLEIRESREQVAGEIIVPLETEFETQEGNPQEERHRAALDQTARIAHANEGDAGRIDETARDEKPQVDRADPELRFARTGIEPQLVPMAGVDPT